MLPLLWRPIGIDWASIPDHYAVFTFAPLHKPAPLHKRFFGVIKLLDNCMFQYLSTQKHTEKLTSGSFRLIADGWARQYFGNVIQFCLSPRIITSFHAWRFIFPKWSAPQRWKKYYFQHSWRLYYREGSKEFSALSFYLFFICKNEVVVARRHFASYLLSLHRHSKSFNANPNFSRTVYSWCWRSVVFC